MQVIMPVCYKEPSYIYKYHSPVWILLKKYTKMSAKLVFVFCAQALLIQFFFQFAFSQCIGRGGIEGWTGPGIAYDGLGYAGPAVYEDIPTPYAYDGLDCAGPSVAPGIYDGYSTPYGYDGYSTPCGYDGLGWAGPAFAPIYGGFSTPYGYDGFSTPYGYDAHGWAGRGLAYEGYPALNFAPTGGSSFKVRSFSPIRPTGISIVSENTFEGPLSVIGEMPFLAVVTLDGVLPTLGAGTINHACGNGVSAILSEGIAPAPGPYAYGPAPYAGIGYGVPAYGSGLY